MLFFFTGAVELVAVFAVAVFVWWCDYAKSGGAYITIDDPCGSVGVRFWDGGWFYDDKSWDSGGFYDGKSQDGG